MVKINGRLSLNEILKLFIPCNNGLLYWVDQGIYLEFDWKTLEYTGVIMQKLAFPDEYEPKVKEAIDILLQKGILEVIADEL